jgi:hypothetical protein
MRDEKSCRASVFGRKIFVIKAEHDPRLLVQQIVQRQICAVVTVRMYESILSIGLHVSKYRIEGNPFLSGAEF